MWKGIFSFRMEDVLGLSLLFPHALRENQEHIPGATYLACNASPAFEEPWSVPVG